MWPLLMDPFDFHADMRMIAENAVDEIPGNRLAYR